MTEKETIEKQLQLLEQEKANLEVLQEKHLTKAKAEVERLEEHYKLEFERVENSKIELTNKLNAFSAI
jgi:hypothetical protein